MPEAPRIMVVGAGVAGLRSALDMACLGYDVTLVDKAPSTGGILMQLDRQFPTDMCGLCKLLPMVDRDSSVQTCLRKGVYHERIHFLPQTTVADVSGGPGQLNVTLRQRNPGILAERCGGCGCCAEICPETAPDPFNADLVPRKAVWLPVPHQTPNAYVIDWNVCTRCGKCVEACPNQAIPAMDPEPELERTLEEKVAAVILAVGAPIHDPREEPFYGRGHLPNVVTSTAFERLCSGSGPTKGQLLRPSDGKPVAKAAWIQCVGSRNLALGAPHCSSVCCMFALKEAIMARERGIEATLFYMDLRTFGRDFQRYRERAEDLGVRLIRCRAAGVDEAEAPGDLKLTYETEALEPHEEDFDLVVLSTGKEPTARLPEFARQDGVIVVDEAMALKDIQDTVLRSLSASARAAVALSKVAPPPARTNGPGGIPLEPYLNARPKPLAVVCTCQGRLDGRLDHDALARALAEYPGPGELRVVSNLCAREGMDAMLEALAETRANRLVLAACQPYAFAARLRALETEGRFPAALAEAVDIRSMSCANDPASNATAKVRHAVEGALNRLIRRDPTPKAARPVARRALIVGAGPAGLAAAWALARQEIDVDLVEKSERVGGNLPHIRTPELAEAIAKLAEQVVNNKRVAIHLQTEVASCRGVAGRLATRLRSVTNPGDEQTLVHGAAILATGGAPAPTQAHGLGSHEAVLSQFELDRRLAAGEIDIPSLNTVVFIQCAGTREEPRNYCSRLCCLKTIEQALELKSKNPDIRVVVFYRDMMTYGASEERYTEARRAGALFIPFDPERKPRVDASGPKPIVTGHDPVLGEDVHFEADLVSLAVGLEPNDSSGLARAFGVKRTQDGFLREVDSKWRPVESGLEGVYICGLARNPARADEALAEGEAAAMRSLAILSRESLPVPRVAARVRPSLCSLCELCVAVCPYDARHPDYEAGFAQVDPTACQGCGACAAACPNSATVLGDFEDKGLLHAIEAALEV